MQTLTVTIQNDVLADKIKAMLNIFRNDGVEIVEKNSFELSDIDTVRARVKEARASKELLDETTYEANMKEFFKSL